LKIFGVLQRQKEDVKSMKNLSPADSGKIRNCIYQLFMVGESESPGRWLEPCWPTIKTLKRRNLVAVFCFSNAGCRQQSCFIVHALK
jgi:hypothetical protein